MANKKEVTTPSVSVGVDAEQPPNVNNNSISKQANAMYKIGNTALVNTEIFEKYLEQFIEPSVELIKHTWGNLKETPNSGAE